MHGEACFACSKRSRTRDAPTPTNISTKSDPEIEKNGSRPRRRLRVRAASYWYRAVYTAHPSGCARRAPETSGFSRNSLTPGAPPRPTTPATSLPIFMSRASCASRATCRSSSPSSRRPVPVHEEDPAEQQTNGSRLVRIVHHAEVPTPESNCTWASRASRSRPDWSLA